MIQMVPADFKDFFMSASASAQQEIISELLSMSVEKAPLGDEGQASAVSCPHCGHNKIRANGKLKGVQRYVCKGCSKNFSETTGKFWYNIKKKDKVHRYIYCLLSGYSIRKSAKETGISIQTSFDWRHNFLTAIAAVSDEEYQGIAESDDLFFPYSEKGKRNLDRPARKRGGKARKVGISDEKVA